MLVNGKNMEFNEAITVKELLNSLKIKVETVVVEVDRNIIEKENYESTNLNSSSEVEIIRFVGGG